MFSHSKCPPQETYDVVNLELAAEIFAAKAEAREKFIINQLAEWKSESGEEQPRFLAAMEYDSKHAPISTNAKQLEEINVMVPSASHIDRRSDEWCHHKLWHILYGLAHLGVFLTETDHLTDRELLTRLCTGVLLDEIRDIPPNDDMSEFIQLNTTGVPPLLIDGTDDEGNPTKVLFVRHLPTPNRCRLSDTVSHTV